MRWTMLGWWVPAAVLALSTPAAAHVKAITPVDLAPMSLETLAAAAPSLDGLGAVIGALAALTILVARCRRAVAIACLALLVLVAFEAGVHSVHHLADQPGECVVAAASAHIGGVAVAPVAFGRPAEAIITVAVSPIGSRTASPLAPDLGRAPPVA